MKVYSQVDFDFDHFSNIKNKICKISLEGSSICFELDWVTMFYFRYAWNVWTRIHRKTNKKCHPLKYKKVYKSDKQTLFETSLTFYVAVDVDVVVTDTVAVTVVVVVFVIT